MNDEGVLLTPIHLLSTSPLISSLQKTDLNLSGIQKDLKERRMAATSSAIKSKSKVTKNKIIRKRNKKATSSDSHRLSGESESKAEIIPTPMYIENLDFTSSSSKKTKKNKRTIKARKNAVMKKKKKSISKDLSDVTPRNSLKLKKSGRNKKKGLTKIKGKAKSDETPDVPDIITHSNKIPRTPKTDVQVSPETSNDTDGVSTRKSSSHSRIKKGKVGKKNQSMSQSNIFVDVKPVTRRKKKQFRGSLRCIDLKDSAESEPLPKGAATPLNDSTNRALLNILTDGLTPSKAKMTSKPTRPLPLMTVADTITIDNFANIFKTEGYGRNHRKPKIRGSDIHLKSPIEGWYNFQIDLIKPTSDVHIENEASKEFDLSVLLRQIKKKNVV